MNRIELDDNLILRMAAGDGNAFSDFYQKTSSAVYGFALSILKNREDAEDVMHDTYLHAYRGAVSYTPKGKPLSWVMTIVRNLSYNRLRAGNICEDISQYENIVSIDDTDRTVDRLVLEKAMEVLTFEERQIVILHALTGMKHREIAELMDMPIGTVLSKYNRSLKKIRDSLDDEGERGEIGYERQ